MDHGIIKQGGMRIGLCNRFLVQVLDGCRPRAECFFAPEPFRTDPGLYYSSAPAGIDQANGHSFRFMYLPAKEISYCRKARSEERREGNECVSTCKSRWCQ